MLESFNFAPRIAYISDSLFFLTVKRGYSKDTVKIKVNKITIVVVQRGNIRYLISKPTSK